MTAFQYAKSLWVFFPFFSSVSLEWCLKSFIFRGIKSSVPKKIFFLKTGSTRKCLWWMPKVLHQGAKWVDKGWISKEVEGGTYMLYSPKELAGLIQKIFLKSRPNIISLIKVIGISVELNTTLSTLWLWLHTLKTFYNSRCRSKLTRYSSNQPVISFSRDGFSFHSYTLTFLSFLQLP